MLLSSLLHRVSLVALLLAIPMPLLAAPERTSIATEEKSDAAHRIVLENDFVRAVVRPDQGGRVESLVHKRSGKDLTMSLEHTRPGGLLNDGVYQQDYFNGDWLRAAYAVNLLDKGPKQARVELTGNGRVWTGIQIKKTITLPADSSALLVEYTMSAGNDANPKAYPDFHFHQSLAGTGKVYFPTEAGVVARPMGNEGEAWSYDPPRGWVAYVNADGTGLAATMEFKHLDAIRTAQSPAMSMEWVLRKRHFAPGNSLRTPVRLAAFDGLKEITGVGERTAVDMQLENGAGTVRLSFAPFQDFVGKVTVYARHLTDDKQEKLGEKELAFTADKLTQTTMPIALPPTGNLAIVAVLSAEKMPDLVVEKPLLRPGQDGVYSLLPLEPREPEAADNPTWSRYHPKDLNFNTTSIPTPHWTWAPKYAGGRPRVLMLVPEWTARHAIEIAERFDMDITVPMLVENTYYIVGDRVRSLTIDEVRQQADKLIIDKEYDAIVMSNNDAWPKLTDKSKAAILDKVKNGAGLVLLQRGEPPEELKPYVPMTHIGYDHLSGNWELLPNTPPLLSGLPWKALSAMHRANGSKPTVGADGKPVGTVLMQAVLDGQVRGNAVAIGQVEKGRLVQSFSEGPLVPVIGKFVADYIEKPVPPFDYWEYHHAMLARMIYWAAKKESPVTLVSVEPSEKDVKVGLSSTLSGTATVLVRLRNLFGEELKTIEQPINLADGKPLTASVPVPAELAGACHLADVIVSNDKGVLAFGGGAFPDGAVTVAKVAPQKPVFLRDEPAAIVVNCTGTLPVGATLRASIYDGAGRLAATADAPAQAETTVSLPLNYVIGPIYDVRVDLLAGDRIVDQGHATGHIKAVRRPEKYHAMFWGGQGHTDPANVIRNVYDLFVDMGITANWLGAGALPYDSPFMQRLNMPYSGSAGGMAATGGVNKAKAAEQPDFAGCMHNPAALAEKRASGERGALLLKDQDILLYSCGDENRGPVPDICFCKQSTDQFRQWLQTQYASIEELNREWGTSYASFNEPVAMEEKEVKEYAATAKTYAPWLDQRNFNKWSYAQLAKPIIEGVYLHDPGAPVGDSGTQESAAYGGRDWWHLGRVYTGLARYGGTQTVEQESYNPKLVLYGWAGYSKPSPINRVQFYGRLSGMDRGIAIFASRSHINPDFTLSEAGKDVRAVLRELQRGIGQMLVSSQETIDPVYILQSPSQVAANYIVGNDALGRGSQNGIINLLDDVGIHFRNISYEQLATGELSTINPKVLILPWMSTLSDAHAKAIEQWVQAGGTLIADLQTGTMSHHGRLLDQPLLDNVFGIQRTGATLAKAGKDEIWKASPAKSPADTLAIATVESGIQPSGAEATWMVAQGSASVPAVFHNRFGQGQAFYFGADLINAYTTIHAKPEDATAVAQSRVAQDLMEGMLQQAGVTPHATVHLRDPKTEQLGRRASWVWTKMKQSGKTKYLVMMRDYTVTSAPTEDLPATLKLREPGVVYDVVAGKLLGRGDAIDLTLTNINGRVLAILPAEVTEIATGNTPAAERGKEWAVPFEIKTREGAADPRIVRVETTMPDGTPHRAYTTDLILESGTGTARVPFAVNDAAGKWTVRLTDVATGTSKTLEVELR